jgi:hypothetical protein
MPEHLNVEDDELSGIDREISQLLAVEPSPDFAAKVRVRIAAQPVAPFGWRYWAGAAVAAVVVIAVAFGMVARRTPPVQAPVTTVRDMHLPPEVDPVAQAPVAVPPSHHVERARRAETRERASEVLVDPALAAAVRRLTTQQRVLPEMPPEPTLSPVVVEPLKVPDISDGGAKQ